MARVDWSFFSSRRKITPASLVSQGIVRDYQSYLKYCQSLDVVPLSSTDFETEFSCLRPPAEMDRLDAVFVPKSKSDDVAPVSANGDKQDSGDLVATVWLAGVDDLGPDPDTPTASTPTPKLNQKSKKGKRQKTKSTSDEVD